MRTFTIVLAHKGAVGLCAGNFDASVQLGDADTWLKKAGGKDTKVSDAMLQKTLGAALATFKHGRARFEGVKITDAVALGKLVLIRGSYPVEGVGFAILFDDSGVLMKHVVER